ncbi:tol-pal system protein YbgF [Nitratireductor soli]|uniref:tol-pal system protein YbgF n=1 Tax=Nitratireductor soli TaxID=1670619 RepID=UPI00065E840C|nr:tol-pal system protein YbgF [Nitratireductor soli]
MFLRTVLGGVLALPLFFVGPAVARDLGFSPGSNLLRPQQAVLKPAEHDGGYIILAQAGDPRVSGLEEEMRLLNGRVEELNFQILQMQDQLRRLMEDNEFRFQELERNGGGAAGTDTPQQRSEAPNPPAGSPSGGSPGTGVDGGAIGSATGPAPTTGEPPRQLGSARFDANGNIIGGEIGAPVDLIQPGEGNSAQGNDVAALPSADNPEELYRNSYEFILSGDYKTAEAGFRDHIERFPGDGRTADAHFWLGEALLGQNRYRDAAEIFLRASRDHPTAKKAPDMLLKLGISLAAMNQRDVACVTYREIGQKYPNISGALQERVKQEQALAGC